MRKLILLGGVIGMLGGLIGCAVALPAGEPTPTELAVTKALPSRSSTVTASITQRPPATSTSSLIAPTIAQPSPIPSILPTVTVPPQAHLKIQCLRIQPSSPGGVQLDGTVILQGDGSVPNVLQNLASGENTPIVSPSERTDYFAVSPDRQHVAYQKYVWGGNNTALAQAELIIADGENRPIKQLPWEKEWVAILKWMDSERLGIIIFSGDPGNSDQRADSLLVLNPFTGARQVLHSNYPAIYNSPPVPTWDGWVMTMYDPTMKYVVYVRGAYDPKSSEKGNYVLWDIRKRQIVTTLAVGWYPPPRWAPDGGRFLVAGDSLKGAYELFEVYLDGRQVQLTHLTAYYPELGIQDYSWSPDGRYVALWLTESWHSVTNPPGPDHLAILDMETKEVTNYCVSVMRTPIWSPDSKQVLVYSPNSENIGDAVLVDPARGLAAQIAKGMEPVGWMTTKP